MFVIISTEFCSCWNSQLKGKYKKNSLALIFALTDFLVKIHLNLQYELQLLIGHKRRQWAIDFLTSIHSLPVVLIPQVHFVAAGRLLVVVPPAGTLLCRSEKKNFSSVLLKCWVQKSYRFSNYIIIQN